MGRLAHTIYLAVLTGIVVFVFIALAFYGRSYYTTSVHERHFHEQNELLKPSGFVGHGIGIAGSAFMVIGVFGYMARKRFRRLSRLGILKHWLEFHIFLCTLGPVLVLYHTSFKFGGIVAVSFWSMVAVVVSGIIGRFIYLQIPRTIEGREMSLNDLNSMETDLYDRLKDQFQVAPQTLSKMNTALLQAMQPEETNYLIRIVKRFLFEQKLVRQIKHELRDQGIKGRNLRKSTRIFKSKIILNRRIAWLSSMQNFLRYWHVAHLPFALIMLVIMIVHIVIAALFGYTWIF
ncbi:hypothetical protein [Maribellus sediminis]|uniref:hypothetical protein n=1 Tax=Maribellus sediminis TaxID=2696285 RepID=UPI00142FEE60|nr:hypothetical protein [Maribellus sediminis]